MRSIKPGRGPSMMGGISGIFMICFGILWTVIAAQGSPIFALFGVLWTGMAVVTTVYNFKNATKKNRHSTYDIVDSNEEPDPFNQHFGGSQSFDSWGNNSQNKFCPYCGTAVEQDYEYCSNCGKKLP